MSVGVHHGGVASMDIPKSFQEFVVLMGQCRVREFKRVLLFAGKISLIEQLNS